MRIIHFKLIKYEELIPIVKNLKFNKVGFDNFRHSYNGLLNSSEDIRLDEDCLTGWEKGSIFVDPEDFSEELEWEILRPITARQMICFKDGMSCIFDYYQGFYSNREEGSFAINLLNELFDCFDDITRCNKKKYVSYSEYVLFDRFMDIVFFALNEAYR